MRPGGGFAGESYRGPLGSRFLLGGSRPGGKVPHRTPATLAAAGGVIVLIGLIAGALWAVLTPAATAIKGSSRIVVVDGIAGVGAFAGIMFAFGVIAAVLSWFVARGWRGLPGYAMALASSLLGSWIAMRIGMWLGGRRFTDSASVAVGDYFQTVPDLWLDGVTRGTPSGGWILLICAPLAATVAYLVCVLLTRTADLGVGDDPVHQSPEVGVGS